MNVAHHPSVYEPTQIYCAQPVPHNLINDDKRMAKIIRHLRDDIAPLYPQQKMPSSWLIKCLIRNVRDENGFCEPWERYTLKILCKIHKKSKCHDTMSPFYEQDDTTPLFPNQEGYTLYDVEFFCSAATKHLSKQLNRR